MVLEKNRKTRALAKKLLQLEDKVRGKPFPEMERVKEISNYSCGPATLEMLLSFVGVEVAQTRLIRSIRAQNKIREYGIDINNMARAARIAGKAAFVFWKKQRATVNDLNTVITKYRFPVGVEWQGDFYENEDEDKGHYSVVTRVDKEDGNLRLADPYFNNYFDYKNLDRKYGIREFVKKWWDVNHIKVRGRSKLRQVKDIRVMFVITPKGEAWPKKLRMTRVS